MAADIAVEQLVKSLSFEVEAVPDDNDIKLKSSSNMAPLNVKIRVRRKNDAMTPKVGVIAVSKISHPDNAPERLRLASSDQTIMSFNMLMETDINIKPQQKQKKLLGKILGTQYDDDDEPYHPSAAESASVSRSESVILRKKLKLSKNAAEDITIPHTKKPKKFFGKCKPGGCLDPPFGEDKYSYLPKEDPTLTKKVIEIEKGKPVETKPTKLKNVIERTSKTKTEPTENKPTKLRNTSDRSSTSKFEDLGNGSILNLYKTESIKNQVEERDSDSIITYPPDSFYSKHNTKDESLDKNVSSKRNSSTTRSRKSFEINGAYYSRPNSPIAQDRAASIGKLNEKEKVRQYASPTKTIQSQIPFPSKLDEEAVYNNRGKIIHLNSTKDGALEGDTVVNPYDYENTETKHNPKILRTSNEIEPLDKETKYDPRALKIGDERLSTLKGANDQNTDTFNTSHKSSPKLNKSQFNDRNDTDAASSETNLERDLKITEATMKPSKETDKRKLDVNENEGNKISSSDTDEAVLSSHKNGNIQQMSQTYNDNIMSPIDKNEADTDASILIQQSRQYDENNILAPPYKYNVDKNDLESTQKMRQPDRDNTIAQVNKNGAENDSFESIQKVRQSDSDNRIAQVGKRDADNNVIESIEKMRQVLSNTIAQVDKNDAFESIQKVKQSDSDNIMAHVDRLDADNVYFESIQKMRQSDKDNNMSPDDKYDADNDASESIQKMKQSDKDNNMSPDDKYDADNDASESILKMKQSDKDNIMTSVDKCDTDNGAFELIKKMRESDNGNIRALVDKYDVNNGTFGPIQVDNDVMATVDKNNAISKSKNITQGSRDDGNFTIENMGSGRSEIYPQTRSSHDSKPKATDNLLNKNAPAHKYFGGNYVKDSVRTSKELFDLPAVDKSATQIGIFKQKHNENSLKSHMSSLSKTSSTTSPSPSIILNLAFQSYTDDSKKKGLKTIDSTLVDQNKLHPNNVIIVQAQLKANEEIRVPIDSQNDICIQIKSAPQDRKDNYQPKHNAFVQFDSSLGSEENRKEAKAKHPITHEIVHDVLTSIYEQELVPLHKVIKSLKDEIDALAGQQALFRDRMIGARRLRTNRSFHSSKRCGCLRKCMHS